MNLNDENPEQLDFSTPAIATSVVDEHGNAVFLSKRNPERKAGTHCKRVLKTVLTQIGLLVLLIGYLIGGGFLFRTLELDNESSVCHQKKQGYLEKLNSSASRVIGIVESTVDADRQQLLVQDIMANFADQLFILDFQPSTDCSVILGTNTGAKWNLANAIYFCATVVTTIGYGHIAPVTFWGRISCIVYAIIGIPLMLIYLAIIGNLLARAFRLIYVNIICCRCFYDIVRRKRQKRRERLLRWQQDLCRHEEEEARRRGLPVPPPKVQPVAVDEDDDELEDEASRNKVIAVPLTVSILVLAAYTLIGAVLFPQWEDWSLVDSAYFAFITISTIGFGDLVPGTGRLHKPEAVVELVVGALYLIFGLALLSMCINLIQDEMVAKIKYVARCCGIGKEEDEELDEMNKEDDTSYDPKETQDGHMLPEKVAIEEETEVEFAPISYLEETKMDTTKEYESFGYENASFVNE